MCLRIAEPEHAIVVTWKGRSRHTASSLFANYVEDAMLVGRELDVVRVRSGPFDSPVNAPLSF